MTFAKGPAASPRHPRSSPRAPYVFVPHERAVPLEKQFDEFRAECRAFFEEQRATNMALLHHQGVIAKAVNARLPRPKKRRSA